VDAGPERRVSLDIVGRTGSDGKVERRKPGG